MSSEDFEPPHINEDNQITSVTGRHLDSFNNSVCLKQDSSSQQTASGKSSGADVAVVKPTDFSIGNLLKANADCPPKDGLPATIDTDDQLETDVDSSRSLNRNFRSDVASDRVHGDPTMEFYRAAALYYGCYVQLFHQHQLQQLQGLSPSEAAEMNHHHTKMESRDETRAGKLHGYKIGYTLCTSYMINT